MLIAFLEPTIMISLRRIRVVSILGVILLLLTGPSYGQRKGGGFRIPRKPPANPAKGLSSLGSSFRPNYPNAGSKFTTSVQVLTSVAAAESLRRSAQGFEGYQHQRETLDSLRSKGLLGSDNSSVAAAESLRRSARDFEGYQNQREILESLRSKGLGGPDSCIFSIYFNLKSGFWSDFFTNPDLFFYVDIEGQGSFLVPQIRWNYGGGPVLDCVLARDVKPGTKIVVRVLDDDSWSDEIWNNILKTRVDFDLAPRIKVIKYVDVSVGYVGGQIRLLDRDVVIDVPDPIATAEFVVPESKDGIWVADGTLRDTSEGDAGKIQFACV